MPQRPDAPVGPNIEVDVDQKYVVELVDLEETPSKFRDQRKDAMSIVWRVILTNLVTGQIVIDNNTGLDYELWQFSPDTTYSNPKTGKKAKAREWTEAFMGRELADEEMSAIIDSGFKEALLHKKAIADLEWFATDNGIERLRIIRLRPFKQPATRNSRAARPAPPDDTTSLDAALGYGVRFDQDGNEVRQPVAAGADPPEFIPAETREQRIARLRRELEEA